MTEQPQPRREDDPDDLLPGAPAGGPPLGADARPGQAPHDDVTLAWDDTWALRGDPPPGDHRPGTRLRRWWRRRRS